MIAGAVTLFVSQALVSVFVASVVVVHALIWDNGGSVKRLLSLAQ